mmetsp:Transcript_56469/g.137039  ORF Transcript_56469/g.137039 Transcript_56469/m.137039 type:complete len:234 (-) Transcript_56469:89-790(-)
MLCPLLWTASSNSCSASLMRFGGSVRIVSSSRPCIKSRVTEAGTDTSLGRPNFPDRSLLGPAVVEAGAPLSSGLLFGFVFIFLLLLFDGVSYFGFFAPFPGDDGQDTVVDVADDGRFRGIDAVGEVAGLSTAPEVVEVVVSLLTATLIDSELSGRRACCLSPTSSSVLSVFTGEVAETESFIVMDPPRISSCWRRSSNFTVTLLPPPPSSCWSSSSSSSPPPKRSSSSSSSFL